MKLKHPHIIILLLVITTLFSACSKKDRSPTLVVTVKNFNDEIIEGAYVRVWPTDDLKHDTLSSGDLNDVFDREALTDARGEARFDFEFSAVLDVDVKYNFSNTDTTTIEQKGHKVVKIETIRQKDEENIFEETVYIE